MALSSIIIVDNEDNFGADHVAKQFKCDTLTTQRLYELNNNVESCFAFLDDKNKNYIIINTRRIYNEI